VQFRAKGDRRGASGLPNPILINTIVLPRRPPRLLDRVLGPVPFQLVRDGLVGVDAEVVIQVRQDDGDVGQFGGDGGALGGDGFLHFGFAGPAEDVQQFAGFDGQGGGEVFGGVELFPVALAAEFNQACQKFGMLLRRLFLPVPKRLPLRKNFPK